MAGSEYIDALYNAKKNAANNALAQRRDQQLGAIQTQETQDTADFNTAIPAYQTQRNQADATGFSNEQAMAERMAQTGNYSGGTMNSNLARERQATSNNRATVTGQENTFRQSFANQMNALRSQRTQANNAYSGDVAASDQSIGAELTSAKMQWQEQENARAAQVAASRASAAAKAKAAPKPTASQLKSSAMSDVDNAFSNGTSQADMLQSIRDNAASYAEYGIDYNTIMKYANDKYTASQDAYTAAGPTLAQSAANSLTNSAFKRW